MEKIHFFDNALVAISTTSLNDDNLLRQLCDEVKCLFEEEDLLVSYVEARGKEYNALLSDTSYSSLISRSRHNYKYGIFGSLGFSDMHNNKFILRYDWRILYRDRYKKAIRSRYFLHNEIVLHFDESFILSSIGRNSFTAFAKNMSSLLEIDYLKVFSPKYDKRRGLGRLDLSDGIHDIYWLNIFGKPFVDIIGQENLLQVPAFKVELVNSDHVSIQVCDEFCHHGQDSKVEVFKKIRDYIGESFFFKGKSIENDKSGVLSVNELFKFLWKSATEYDNQRLKADVCPKYDYRKMII